MMHVAFAAVFEFAGNADFTMMKIHEWSVWQH
jgi:hypothetical protein